jgi:hypothetical protein
MHVSKKPAKLLAALTIITLTSCASSAPQIQTTEAACRDWQPITYSSCVADTCTADDPLNIYDSEETVRQIERVNLYFGALCQPE